MNSGRGAQQEVPLTGQSTAAAIPARTFAEVADERLRKAGVGGYARQTLSLHDAGGGEDRKSEGLQNGGDEHGPNRERQAKHRHAGGPHLDDRRQIVDGAEHRTDANARDAEKPHGLGPGAAWRRFGDG